MAMRVLVEAYGCTMNRGEAEEFSDGLLAMGHDIASGESDADAFAIFTCGVIDTTERRMLRRISELASVPGKPLLVCGCLPEISPVKIMKLAPGAKLLGPGSHMAGLVILSSGKAPARKPPVRSVGILPIASGCSGECTYCITRKARGGLLSRSPGDLKSRLGELVKSGAAEIQLCAQDTAVYGLDIGTDLAELIRELGSADGDFMLRIGMMNPATALSARKQVTDALDNPKVFKFLHLPVQSGSDRVLEAMGRGHTVAEFESLVSDFRARFPGLSLSTDIITGFPGETEEEFLQSARLLERLKPDIVNITRFSSRPGTKAHAMKGKVPSRISKDRSRILTDLRFGVTAENYSAYVGHNVRALATEQRMEGTTFLRTAEYKPVVVTGDLAIGRWYGVRISGHARTHLLGGVIVK